MKSVGLCYLDDRMTCAIHLQDISNSQPEVNFAYTSLWQTDNCLLRYELWGRMCTNWPNRIFLAYRKGASDSAVALTCKHVESNFISILLINVFLPSRMTCWSWRNWICCPPIIWIHCAESTDIYIYTKQHVLFEMFARNFVFVRQVVPLVRPINLPLFIMYRYTKQPMSNFMQKLVKTNLVATREVTIIWFICWY